MEPEEIVDYIVDYYKTHPRSIITNEVFNWVRTCLYNGPNNSCCAFALAVKEEERENLIEDKTATRIIEELGPLILQDKFQVFPDNILKAKQFWQHIQALHDNDSNWKEVGGESHLTDRGKEEVRGIKLKF